MPSREATDPRRPSVPETSRPVLVGEVLYDIFTDGTEVLGGAPFNVAWNLHGLGCPPLFVSRVGTDARGEAVVDGMASWGMDVAGLQRDAHRETGTVRVRFDDGQPSFEIVADRAWDHVEVEAAMGCAGAVPTGLMYRGRWPRDHP